MDPATQKLSLLDRQHDDAWVGGPPPKDLEKFHLWVGLLDNKRIWFTSEETGYSHLYTDRCYIPRKKQALTKENLKCSRSNFPRAKNIFILLLMKFILVKNIFTVCQRMVARSERLTTMTGAHEAEISPDEKTIAFRYSYSNKPGNCFSWKTKPGAKQNKSQIR